MTETPLGLLPELGSRDGYFDYFDGYVEDQSRELNVLRANSGLEKTYMLETVNEQESSVDIHTIFQRSGYRLREIPDGGNLFRIEEVDKPSLALAVLELLTPRYPVIYTLLPASQSDAWVRKLVEGNPYLDRLWLSAPFFSQLWSFIEATSAPNRYSRLTFDYEALYEEKVDDEGLPQHLKSGISERRNSRFTMVERVSVIRQKLEPLRQTYTPLYSLTHLRFPATGRGGHDFYHDGKVTNRSASFVDHRQTVEFVVDMYARLTSAAEENLWFGTQASTGSDGSYDLQGSTVTLRFSQPLEEATFRRWIMSIFGNRRNRFRISGYPTWISNSRVQANAIDHHLWQPLLLEFTTEGMTGVLPRGTCANTVNRLITNVQRFVDPAVNAWIGDIPYEEVVSRALEAAS